MIAAFVAPEAPTPDVMPPMPSAVAPAPVAVSDSVSPPPLVEPVVPPPRPLHILAQQLMALALQEGGVGRHEWFSWVEAVPASVLDLVRGRVAS